MQFNLLVTQYDTLILVLLALTLDRSFIILNTTTEHKSKSYVVILISFLRSWPHIPRVILVILVKLLFTISIIVFNMMKLLVILFIIKLFAQIKKVQVLKKVQLFFIKQSFFLTIRSLSFMSAKLQQNNFLKIVTCPLNVLDLLLISQFQLLKEALSKYHLH